jgi:HK97 family phage prohead protease
MEYKALRFEVKRITDSGEFEGYASTRKRDSYGDIVAKGAFKRTIDHNKNFPILWFHDPAQPIGLSTYMEEDDHGLYTKGQIDLDIELGQRVYSGMKKGYIDRMSIGYRTLKDDWDEEQNARLLKEVQLLEYSMITKNFAANDAALISSVKSFPGMLQQVKNLRGRDLNVDPELIREAIKSLQALLKPADPPPSTQPTYTPPDAENPTLEALLNEMKAFVRRNHA